MALEKYPYLYGVIWEGIRLSYGVSTRLARVPRNETLTYRSKDGEYQYVVPAGTPIGMSSYISHHDERAFPNSSEFVPERWIAGTELYTPNVERGMFAFSKGGRACLGQK